MPQNFPEIWLKRVITNIDKKASATFLDGIPELDVDVSSINSGDVTEKNIIHVASTGFDVDVLLNNTTYPIPAQEYADGTIDITLDKYQTKVTTVKDDDIKGASYDKIDSATKAHTRSISREKFQKAIHSIAPDSNKTLTPIIVATGAVDDTGLPTLTYEDLVNASAKADDAGFPKDSRRAVLTDRHWNNLLLDRKNFGDQLVNYAVGKPNPKIAGWELHNYSGNPVYVVATKTKKPYGSVASAGERQASIFFSTDNIAKKTGETKQYFKKADGEPGTQTNELNYRHYFVATRFQEKLVGAIL